MGSSRGQQCPLGAEPLLSYCGPTAEPTACPHSAQFAFVLPGIPLLPLPALPSCQLHDFRSWPRLPSALQRQAPPAPGHQHSQCQGSALRGRTDRQTEQAPYTAEATGRSPRLRKGKNPSRLILSTPAAPRVAEGLVLLLCVTDELLAATELWSGWQKAGSALPPPSPSPSSQGFSQQKANFILSPYTGRKLLKTQNNAINQSVTKRICGAGKDGEGGEIPPASSRECEAAGEDGCVSGKQNPRGCHGGGLAGSWMSRAVGRTFPPHGHPLSSPAPFVSPAPASPSETFFIPSTKFATCFLTASAALPADVVLGEAPPALSRSATSSLRISSAGAGSKSSCRDGQSLV